MYILNLKQSARLCLPALLGSFLLSTQVRADDAKTTGLLAGLGIAAASGKTTLGQGAGAIEAGLLGADNFQQAGAIIAGVGNALRGTHSVLIVAHDEKVDLATWQLLGPRLKAVETLVTSCKPKPDDAAAPKGAMRSWMKVLLPQGTEPMAGDFVGVGLTDVGVGGIIITADDRMLVNGILMNANTAPIAIANTWTAQPELKLGIPADYRTASDLASLPNASSGQIKRTYDSLVATIDKQRGLCSQTDGGKAAMTTADALVNGLNTASATGTPLVNAMQLEQIGAGNPHVLRIAIEQVGGTSIARAGIPYMFGWPNAATVAAGLLVSFKLTDPVNGKIEALGLVRCMMGQSNLKRLTNIIQRQDNKDSRRVDYAIGKPVCDYRVWTPT